MIATTRELALCQRLCELNNSWSPCTVVAIEDVYNEFSGGRPDICALRNFLRMLYERASGPAEAPAFLLLVGQASYNLRKVGGTFLPTYQSRESFYPPETYGSDDFFGFLTVTKDSGARIRQLASTTLAIPALRAMAWT